MEPAAPPGSPARPRPAPPQRTPPAAAPPAPTLPSGTVSHILFAIIGLFFLAPSLEQRWGGARLLRFLFFTGVLAYAFQMLLEIALPATLARKLVGEYWFGSVPVLEAVAIAWALSFRGQTV